MSKGPWKRDRWTGIPMSLLTRVDEQHLTDEGHVDVRSLADCNVFCVNSIAALCGYRDTEYFRGKVLSDPNCPIHVRRMNLTASDSDEVVAQICATHVNSAVAGGKMWQAMHRENARARGIASTVVASGSLRASC